MKSGLLTGTFHLGGLVSDPEFTGNFNVNKFTVAVPDYVAVDLVGENVKITAENNAFIIDSNYLNDVSGSYEFIFKSSVPPRVSDLQFYGLVNDNGLYHYELLSSNVLSLANGSNVNYKKKKKNRN